MTKLTKITIPIIFLVSTVFIFLFFLSINNSAIAQNFDKTIFFPEVNVTNSNNQNYSLDEEFILFNNTAAEINGQTPVKVVNPDFWLFTPFVKLVKEQKYVTSPLNEGDINYSSISIKIAPIRSVSSDIRNLTDADPDNPDDMTLGTPIELSHYVAGGGGDNSNSFNIPANLQSGNYILYVYLQYPYNITGVFSNAATVTSSDNNSNQVQSNNK
jgi:hypothetical protein